MGFPDILKTWRSRWAAIHHVRSLEKHQRGALARDLALPESNVIRLIARGNRTENELHYLTSLLGLDMKSVGSSNPGLARDISIACSECAAIKRCRRELDAGSARTRYHAYCPNAQTFDDLRQEVLKRNHQIMAERVGRRE
ncbi:DUF6455 family protein [Bradyrhizobium sp. G127]|jgi:prephenate dehydrogenase|uniref:DUF6455 family protein n=1 Tax=Bradyrhizobium sp. G127 TaxID=2904800 RepID=UPI001F2507FC|nr:DUF6455 family protein [Bradyrhizobium sp. G127]MCF2524665.1 DUF6455 family protein [Bradyrhizobium sp. G127]